jgi:hypothetical protein
MSEFSESYHLRSESQQDGVALLRAAGLRGYVFPPENGWVTVVAEGEEFEPNQRLIGAAPGLLLHYVHAEDHGWGFELYRAGKMLSGYDVEWDSEIRVTRDEIDRGVLAEYLGDGIRELDDQAYRRLFHPTFDEHMELALNGDESVAERFTEAAGLTNYSWLSYHYVDSDYDDDPELAAQGIVRVE